MLVVEDVPVCQEEAGVGAVHEEEGVVGAHGVRVQPRSSGAAWTAVLAEATEPGLTTRVGRVR